MLFTSSCLPVYAGSREIEVEGIIVEEECSVTRAASLKSEKLVIKKV